MLPWTYHRLVPTLMALTLGLISWMALSWTTQHAASAPVGPHVSAEPASMRPKPEFQILAIAVTPRPAERKVLVRRLRTGEIAAIGIGEELGPRRSRVVHIGRGTVTLRTPEGKMRQHKLGEPLR